MPEFRRYRAPAEDGGVLADPDWEAQLRLVAANRAHRRSTRLTWAGCSLDELSAELRAELLGGVGGDTPLIVSGHQPELFHPGVLIKNAALDRLARRVNGVGLHVVIDSDLCRSTSIAAPTGTLAEPRHVAIAYDDRAAAIPYEERRVTSDALFDAFAAGVEEAVAPLGLEPGVGVLWRQAGGASPAAATLADRLNAVRRALQAEWGDRTTEVGLSAVGGSRGFLAFVVELLSRAAETRAAYNAALDEYRRAHRLRTPAQPLPDLAERAGWIEAPLWMWTRSEPVRRPLWVRANGGVLRLTNLAGWEAELPAAPAAAVDALQTLRSQGVKIRSRALATTLFARWALADLFLHGIGGAKYDQVTDRWSARLFGAAPPPHATLSATFRLPIPAAPASPPPISELQQRLRSLRYHPERFIDDGAPEEAQRLCEAKRTVIATPKTPTTAAERHRRIVEANLALQPFVASRHRAAEARISDAEAATRAAAVLRSREHSFVLFPQGWLAPRLVDAIGL